MSQWHSRTASRRHNLPAELNSFVGRRHEMAEVKRLLQATRLLTLIGTGGAGKTRLALRVAADLVRAFPDGVWAVELANLQDPALVAQAVFTALRLRDRSASWPVAVLTEYLSEKRLLLVMDNCEHLLTATAVLVETLLRGCPGLRVLTTSREPLGIPGEVRFAVPSLSLPDPKKPTSLQTVLASDAARLFADRAGAVVPGFEVTSDNQADVAGLCRRLDGNPLAIELATVRLPVLDVHAITERLDDRFRLLTGGSKAALQRHQTLQAAIEWSYHLLSEDEQLLWQRLSVFAHGFDLDSSEVVCADDRLPPARMVDLLGALVDKSILVADRRDGSTRFGMLETIRQFGRERLAASGEEASTLRRHRDWIAALAERAGKEWHGANQASWLDRIEQELGNIRVALEHCLKQAGEADVGLGIAGRLWLYWEARGVSEGRRWLHALLDTERVPSRERVKALAAAGVLATGDPRAARALLEESLALAQGFGQIADAAFAMSWLSGLAFREGDVAAALALAKQARDLYEQLHDPYGIAQAQLIVAGVESVQGHAENAVAHFDLGLGLLAEIGEQWMRATVLSKGLSIAYWRMGRFAEAAECQKQSLELMRALDDRSGAPLSIEFLAWIASAEGHAERAACLFGASKATWGAWPATLPEPFQTARTKAETAARDRLGEKAYAAAFGRGTQMNFADAIVYALEEKHSARTRQSSVQESLTRRELEIAALVAEGLSNKQIAARLVIGQRTAETHIENIMNKLGVNTRAQVAAWAVAQRVGASR